MEGCMTQLERARRIIASTPGNIAHAVFEQAGVKNRDTVRALGLSLKDGMWRRG